MSKKSQIPQLGMPSGNFSKKINLLFIAIMAGMSIYFWFWGQNYTHQNHIILFTIAVAFGLFMAFNIGGNDVANSFGTSVGAKTLTIPQALAVAAIFEVSGAVIAGGEVTKTIRSGIVDLSSLTIEPIQFMLIMVSALLAAALWLFFATKRGWPVSTTHSIVGGIVGSSIVLGIMISGAESSLALVQWHKIGEIVISWILSPLLGGIVAYILFFQIKKHILNYNDTAENHLKVIKQEKKKLRQKQKKAFEKLSELQQIAYTGAMQRDAQAITDEDYQVDDLESDYYKELYRIEQQKNEIHAYYALQNWVPIIAALGGMMICSMLIFKGLKHMHLGLTTLHNYLIVFMVGALIWMATFIYAKTLKNKSLEKSTFLMFSWMQVFTASGFAFSHGSNDIANAIGPFAAILDVLRTGTVGSEATVPPIVMITFGISLIVGLWFIGKEVIQTVGENLTKMHPSSGFAAELAAASVVMLASLLGLPVSSTHILVGAVLGIGMVNKSTNWALMKPIGMAWVITVPAAALLSGFSFVLLNLVF